MKDKMSGSNEGDTTSNDEFLESEHSSDDEVDAANIDKEIISQRLEKDAKFKEGKRFSLLGDFVIFYNIFN